MINFWSSSLKLSDSLAYLKKQWPKFHHFLNMLPVDVARSSSDGNAICYVLPVLWMTSCFHIIEQIGQNQRRRVFRAVHHVVQSGRSLPSPTASCMRCRKWPTVILRQQRYTGRRRCKIVLSLVCFPPSVPKENPFGSSSQSVKRDLAPLESGTKP